MQARIISRGFEAKANNLLTTAGCDDGVDGDVVIALCLGAALRMIDR